VLSGSMAAANVSLAFMQELFVLDSIEAATIEVSSHNLTLVSGGQLIPDGRGAFSAGRGAVWPAGGGQGGHGGGSGGGEPHGSVVAPEDPGSPGGGGAGGGGHVRVVLSGTLTMDSGSSISCNGALGSGDGGGGSGGSVWITAGRGVEGEGTIRANGGGGAGIMYFGSGGSGGRVGLSLASGSVSPLLSIQAYGGNALLGDEARVAFLNPFNGTSWGSRDFCGFESGLCSWTEAGNGHWVHKSGGTPSGGTGPSSAYEGSYYMFLDNFGGSYGQTS
jgi:hypothetical protein